MCFNIIYSHIIYIFIYINIHVWYCTVVEDKTIVSHKLFWTKKNMKKQRMCVRNICIHNSFVYEFDIHNSFEHNFSIHIHNININHYIHTWIHFWLVLGYSWWIYQAPSISHSESISFHLCPHFFVYVHIFFV